jgi:hypothetical protein
MVDRLGPGILLGDSLVLWSLSVAAVGFASNYRQLLRTRAAGSRRGLSYAAPSAELGNELPTRDTSGMERSSDNAQHNQCHIVVLESACGECLRGREDSGHRFKGGCSVAGPGKLD